ncbi:maleylpyruvate isomerase N-terminal domain-containing protein [Pseudarthrobacter sp. alpha12b]
MFVAAVASLSDDEMAGPSLCEGWSRAHVIAHVASSGRALVHHHDLDTAWTIEEADPDSLLNAIEAVVRSLRAKGAPGMTLVTEERDQWIIGNGALRVESDREGLLQGLARGDAATIEAEGPVPALPSW